MKKHALALVAAALFSLASCAATGVATGPGTIAGNAATPLPIAGPGLSLTEAIERSAQTLAARLPAGTRVAIVADESEIDGHLYFAADAHSSVLAAALTGFGIEVADRSSLAFAVREAGISVSGGEIDEAAISAARIVGADVAIAWRLRDAGAALRLSVNAARTDTGERIGLPDFYARNGGALPGMAGGAVRHGTESGANVEPQTAGAFIDRGIMFYSLGMVDQAISDFSEAMRLRTDFASAHFWRGAARAGASDFGHAIVDLTESLRLNPADAAAYAARGAAHFAMGNLGTAVADFDLAIRLNPANARAHLLRGEAHLKEGEPALAAADFETALRLDPVSHRAMSGLEIASLTLDIHRNPNDAHQYFLRGAARMERGGELGLAIADFDEAIRLNPADADARIWRGIALSLAGERLLAIADFGEAIRLNPADAWGHFYRGRAFLDEGELGLAIADFDEAIRLDPADADARAWRGNAHLETMDFDRAIADFEAVLRIDPNNSIAATGLERARSFRGDGADVQTHLDDGRARFADGDFGRAIADFTEWILANPNDAQAHFLRGNVHLERWDLELAVADFARAILLDSGFAEAHNSRGIARFLQGELDLAIADFEAALRIDPSHSGAATSLEYVRRLHGQ